MLKFLLKVNGVKMHKNSLNLLMNTSSWINLFEIELHEYLVRTFKVYTTPKVKKEILEGKDFADDAILFEIFLNDNMIKIISNFEIPNELKHEISISSGEIELARFKPQPLAGVY